MLELKETFSKGSLTSLHPPTLIIFNKSNRYITRFIFSLPINGLGYYFIYSVLNDA